MNFLKPVASLQTSLFLVLLFQISASAQTFTDDGNILNGTLISQAGIEKTVEVEKTNDKEVKDEALPKETESEVLSPATDTEKTTAPAEGEEIISITDALKQGQLSHEKNLVDKFLLGIAILFFVIAFLLFNSLPPNSEESSTS